MLVHKLTGTARRIFHAVSFLPGRVYRLGNHFYRGVTGLFHRRPAVLPQNRFFLWWTELSFLLLDLFMVPELYETLVDWLKWSTRPLTSAEIEQARSVFGNLIPYDRVRVDEKALIACRTHHIYYVSFFTINAWGPFRPDTFIHEMMHVWQYTQLGATYIPLALLAQRTRAGYNYGGIGNLKKCMDERGSLDDFNLEQQAEILADYYCLREGLTPRWCRNEPHWLPVFEYFAGQVKAGGSHTAQVSESKMLG